MTRIKRMAGSSLARLLAGFFLVAIVFVSAWLWSLTGPLTQATLRQQERNLTAVAQSAALLVVQADRPLGEVAQQVVSRTDLRLTIVAADGTVLADSDFDPSRMENHAGRPEIDAALSGRIASERRASRTEGEDQLYVAAPGSYNGQNVAVRVSQSLDEIRSIAARSRRSGLLLLAGAFAVALAVAIPAIRAAARPIQELSTAAERMAKGNLSVTVPEVPTDLEGLAGALASLRDQMRARIEALEAERRTLRSTLDGLTDAVLLLEGEHIRFANRAADRLFRTPPGGWTGATLSSSPLPESVRAAILAQTDVAGAAAFDLDADPTGRALRLVVSPLDPEAPDRTIIVISDVTERSRLDKIRRDFVANASHELKTPVAGIKLLAESAETAAADGDDAQAIAFARQIAVEVERLQRLVGDLLDLSRLESLPAPDAITDARVALGNALVSHAGAAARKGLSVVMDDSAVRGTDVFVSADPTDVTVALDNLIDNAIAYTDHGEVTVRLGGSDEVVAIEVADTGAGIGAEHLPRIFERFYRIDGGRSRDAGGTGLGLSLVKHVVERNGGSVSVDSVPGTGSTFTLRFRRAR